MNYSYTLCCEPVFDLELKALLCCASIRKWGGKYSNGNIRVFASPKGKPISNCFIAEFKKLDVELIFDSLYFDRTDSPFLSKIMALEWVENHYKPEYSIYLDCDILLFNQPDLFFDFSNNIILAGSQDSFNVLTISEQDCEILYKHFGYNQKKAISYVSSYGDVFPLIVQGGAFSSRAVGLWTKVIELMRYFDSNRNDLTTIVPVIGSNWRFNRECQEDQFKIHLALVSKLLENQKFSDIFRILPANYNYHLPTSFICNRHTLKLFKDIVILHYHNALCRKKLSSQDGWRWYWPDTLAQFENDDRKEWLKEYLTTDVLYDKFYEW